MKDRNRLKNQCFQGNRLHFAVTVVILGINAALLAGVAILMQQIVDIASLGTEADIVEMLQKIVVYVVCIAVGWMVERYFRNRFIEKALCQLKGEVFGSIAQKGISAFSRETTGRYLSILTNDINTIENHYLQNYFGIILNCCYFVAALVLMLWYDVWLTVCAMGLVGGSLAISIMTGGKLTEEERKVSVQNEKFVELVKDLLSGFSVVKSFRAEKEITGLFSEENSRLERNKCCRMYPLAIRRSRRF